VVCVHFTVLFGAVSMGLAPDFQLTMYSIGNDFGVAAADFNGDGRSDIVLISETAVSVLLGDGRGSFQAPIVTPLPSGFYASKPKSGDFNGDGVVDLVVIYSDVSMELTGDAILYGNGDGSFQSPRYLTYLDDEWYAVNSLAVGDVNGDGLSDVCHVIVDWGFDPDGNGVWGSYVVAMLNLGDGSFLESSLFNHDPYYWQQVQLSDLNGDAFPDIVAGSQTSMKVALNRGDGTFDYPEQILNHLPGPVRFAIGRFNGDSNPDIATMHFHSNQSTLLSYLGNGDGTFTTGMTSPPGDSAFTELAADVNRDGKLDVFGVDPNGVGVFFGDGLGLFGYRRVLNHEDMQANYGSATADFNGDGWPDLVSANGNHAVFVLLNDGNWSLPPPVPAIWIFGDARDERNKGNTTFSFQVTLSNTSSGSVTVSYRTTDGTATTSDRDYAATSGTLTFSPGQTSKTITVQVKGDRKREANESFYVELLTPSANATIGQGRGTGTIINDD